MGASAGGVEALQLVVAGLPAQLPAAVFIVLHLAPNAPSKLAQILDLAGPLPVRRPADGDPILPGHIYVPTPDMHLLVQENHIRLTHGPKENRARPAVDVLFRSAAFYHGQRVIGIVLSGNLDDGTAGLWAVKQHGGIAMVQSPEDAQFPSMPLNALKCIEVDHVLPVADMPHTISSLVHEPVMQAKQPENIHATRAEVDVALGADSLRAADLLGGVLSANTCPECHGVMLEVQEGPVVRYRCHTGHAYSMQTLLDETEGEIESGLWNTLRAFDEKIMLLKKLSLQAQSSGDPALLAYYAQRMQDAEHHRAHLRQMAMAARARPG